MWSTVSDGSEPPHNERELDSAESVVQGSRSGGQLTHQPCNLIPLHSDQSQKVKAVVFKWVIMKDQSR